MKIALAGNPNCGKTTMFNGLTGSTQFIGNWPGVTVEHKEGRLLSHRDVVVTDLPGIYSLSPYSLEEVISRNYLLNEDPGAIIDLVDATNLERNLYLTTQVLELGVPVVLALNMIDVVHRSGQRIDGVELGEMLGCAVVETSALKGAGCSEAAEMALTLAQQSLAPSSQQIFSAPVEAALAAIGEALGATFDQARARWYAVKLFERDEQTLDVLQLTEQQRSQLEQIVAPVERQLGDDSETIITNERYDYIARVVDTCAERPAVEMTLSDKIDRVVTNRILAIPIFVIVIFGMYFASVTSIGALSVTNWVNDKLFGTWITNGATSGLHAVHAAGWLDSLIVNGIINGVGTVLGFVPQMLVLFFCLAILEDCGYMARVAFIMDRIFRKFGLSGKSFIPIMVGTGCGVPAIMATRTIENERDRRMTIMLTTFMPCTAKTVIIAMITTTFFPHSFLIAPAMYFLGMAVIVCSAIGLKKTRYFGGETAPFVMELPPYRVPSPKGVMIHTWERSRMFIIKAGTIIFAVVVAVWFFSNFNVSLQLVTIQHSMLADFGRAVTTVFAPLGFATWKATVATITALMAKESGIATLATLNGVADPDRTRAVMQGIGTMFVPISAFSFMILNLFDPPCIVAMATTGREMNSRKWTTIAIGYQVVLGYSMAFITYQLGSFLFYGAAFRTGQMIAIAVLALMAFLVLRPASAQEPLVATGDTEMGAA
jgi:ferrous iron transport protein B